MWTLQSNDKVLLDNIKRYEGTIEYQKKLGYYHDNKFWVYKDSLGYPTIGYGHLLISGETFKDGLTDQEAEDLLAKDLGNTVRDAKSIYEQYKMNESIEVQHVLTQMVFQMGKQGVLGFKNTLTALANKDYTRAAAGIRASKWYRQTTSRAEELAKIIERQ